VCGTLNLGLSHYWFALAFGFLLAFSVFFCYEMMRRDETCLRGLRTEDYGLLAGLDLVTR
jgi:hypothetical protein